MSTDYVRTKVLFVCLGNACRGPMAEAIARLDAYDVIEPFSAGLTPMGYLAGMAKQIILKNGYSVKGLESKGISPEIWEQTDIVINMTGRPLERALGEHSKVEDWEIKDPFGCHRSEYEQAFERIRRRVAELAEKWRREQASVRSGNRRAQERLCLVSPIFVNLNGANGGAAFDVSKDGFGLSCAMALPDGPLQNMRIQFPGTQQWIEVSGHVAWKSESDKKAGIRFEGLKQEASRQIRSWISTQLAEGNFREQTGGIDEDRNKLQEFPITPHSGSATASDYHEFREQTGAMDEDRNKLQEFPITPHSGSATSSDYHEFQEQTRGIDEGRNKLQEFPITPHSGSATTSDYHEFREQTGGMDEDRNKLQEFPITPHSGGVTPSDYHEAFERIRLRVAELAEKCRREHPPVRSGNRRAQERLCLVSPIFVNLNGATEGVAFDVSKDGFGLSYTMALPDGPLRNMRIQFPGTQQWIEVSGHVAWKSESDKKAGIRFEGLKQEASRQIRSWISTQLAESNLREQTGRIGEGRHKLLEFPITPLSGSAVPSPATVFAVSEEEEKVSLFPPAAAPTLPLPRQPASAPGNGASFKKQPDERGLPSSSKPARALRLAWAMRPRWVAFAAIGVLVGLFSLSMEWVVVWRVDRNKMSASLAQEPKASSEPIENATAPTGAIANTPGERNLDQRPSGVEPVISGDFGGIPNTSVKDREPQGWPAEHPTSVADLSAPDPVGAKNELSAPRTKQLLADPRASVSKPPLNGLAKSVLGIERPDGKGIFRRTNSSVGNADARRAAPMDPLRAAAGVNSLAAMKFRPLPGGIVPPATSRQLEPPVTPAVILASSSAAVDPKAMENLVATAKQPAIPPSITGAIAILTDPYPSLRLPDRGISRKQHQATSLQLGHLLSRVDPVYPEDAKTHGVQGTVKLHAIIGRQGSVENLEPVDGSPVLVAAAINAVRQWRYSETILAGQLVETEEDIAVTFRLSNPPPPPN